MDALYAPLTDRPDDGNHIELVEQAHAGHGHGPEDGRTQTQIHHPTSSLAAATARLLPNRDTFATLQEVTTGLVGGFPQGDEQPLIEELPGPTRNRWASQGHLDRFFHRIYLYFRGKGLKNIVMAQVLDHLTVVWLALLLIFLTAAVDYHALYDRLEAKPCAHGDPDTAELTKRDCHGNLPIDLSRISRLPAGVWVLLSLFSIVWFWRLAAFILSLRDLLDMQAFYHDALNIDSRELQTIAWSEVMDKLVAAQKKYGMCRTKPDLNHLDICNLIMRRMNFLIALANEPFFERAITLRKKIFMPLSLQWNIHRCLRGAVFREQGIAKQVKDASSHQRCVDTLVLSFRLSAILNLLLCPLILVYRLADFCFRNSEELRKSPGAMATRQWTPYARWKLRSFNEVEHYFIRRLNRSYDPSAKYVEMFTSESLAIVGRFFTFLFGGFIIVLLAMSIAYDEAFFLADLTAGRSVGWWMGMCGIVVAISRGLIPDENLVFEPKAQMSVIRRYTLYNPEKWFGREKSLDTLDEFTELFQFKLVVFLEELFSVFITPYLLFFHFPLIADDIITFFRNNSVRRDGIGDVCLAATFRYEDAPALPGSDSNAGSAIFEETSLARDRAARTKMEQSCIAFKTHHPSWREPGVAILDRFTETEDEDWNEQRSSRLHESLFQESVETLSQAGSRPSLSVEHSEHSGYTPPVMRRVATQDDAAVVGAAVPLVPTPTPRRGWSGGVEDIDV
eukprot:m.80384 g.80384  ORF g.80384 m.80384 type:complete len:734 (+) comp14662_c0_seq1:403-2604(+)